MMIHDYTKLNSPRMDQIISNTPDESYNQEINHHHKTSDPCQPQQQQPQISPFYISSRSNSQQPTTPFNVHFQPSNDHSQASIWNNSSQMQQYQKQQPQFQPQYPQHRRNSSIDNNIWNSASPNTNANNNIWTRRSLTNLPPPLTPTSSENYTSSANQIRSSSITDCLSSPLAPEKNGFNASSPTELIDSLRRHSYTDGLTNSSCNNFQHQGNLTDQNILKMVDEYFEHDAHERVKVTMQILNDRFFDEEKMLSDAYQLPKFPIESSLRNYQLILVGFKAGRIEVFYLPTSSSTNINSLNSPSIGSDLTNLKVGDLVIVEADRGRDLGKVFKMNVSIDEARLLKLLQFQEQQAALNEHMENSIIDDLLMKTEKNPNTTTNTTTTHSTVSPPTLHFPKSVISLAQPNEVFQILNKKQDEEKACRLCLAKIANATNSCIIGAPTSPATQDLLQMKLIDAEYQFDRKKLIFYYSTSKRIDFRDLVRELFRIYKTRIWMCAVIGLPFQVSRKNSSPLSSGVNLKGQISASNRRAGFPQWNASYQQQQDFIPRDFDLDQRQQMANFQGSTGNNTFIQSKVPPVSLQPQQTLHELPNGKDTSRNDENIEEENSGESFVLKSLVDSINH